MAVALKTMYEVADAEVTVTVTIGEGQLGSSRVRVGDREVTVGDVSKVKIGKGSAIAGKELFIKTVVADVNDQTNRTSVSYELKGGKVDKTFDLDATVDEEGGSAIYRATFELKRV
jgi:hypothetical protein